MAATGNHGWMLCWAGIVLGLVLALGTAASAAGKAQAQRAGSHTQLAAGDGAAFDISGELKTGHVVEVPAPKSRWLTVGAPLALAGAMFSLLALIIWMVPFKPSTVGLQLYHYPTGVKRGLALAVILLGVAYCGGATEIVYQLNVNDGAVNYFHNMSTGHLIAISHVHLFGWVTTFLIIGIPFSMQFNHLRPYQWLLPIGLAASITDLVSWWGIKFVSGNFEYVSILCGILFAFSYLYMLIALLRVLLFPHVIWFSDKDADERRRLFKQSRLRRMLSADQVSKEEIEGIL